MNKNEAIENAKVTLRIINLQKTSITFYLKLAGMTKWKHLNEYELNELSKLMEKLDVVMLDSDNLLLDLMNEKRTTNEVNKHLTESFQDVAKVVKSIK